MTDLIKRRRDRKGIGGAIGIERAVPPLSAARESITNTERLLLALLRSEISRFVKDEDLLTLFFSHVFDPMAGEDERKEFVKNFIRNEPRAVIGYPRASAEFPIFAIVLMAEEESQPVIGDYTGQTDINDPDEEDDEFASFEGGIWEQSFGIFIYAQHPDVCLYMYHFVKMIMSGGKEFLLSNGVIDATYSGGELAPDEQYLPNNMFARVFNVKATVPFTVPRIALADPRRMKVVGLYRSDMVVDGVPGGISTPEEDDGDEGPDGDEG